MNSLYCGYRTFTSYWWKHWFSPSTYYYWIKFKTQRANRGWANCDVWSLDGYLAEWLPDALTHLKKTQHGHPGNMTEEEWDATIDKMIDGFVAYNRISDSLYEEELGEYNSSDERYEKMKILEERDEKIWGEGSKLFIEKFGDLWD